MHNISLPTVSTQSGSTSRVIFAPDSISPPPPPSFLLPASCPVDRHPTRQSLYTSTCTHVYRWVGAVAAGAVDQEVGRRTNTRKHTNRGGPLQRATPSPPRAVLATIAALFRPAGQCILWLIPFSGDMVFLLCDLTL